MARRNQFSITDVLPANTSPAAQDEVSTTLGKRRVLACDPSSDESFVITGVVPQNYRGGTVKVRTPVCANTTTASHAVGVGIKSEFRTADAAEAMGTDNFDASADSSSTTFSTTAYEGRELVTTITPAVSPVAGDLFRLLVTNNSGIASGVTVDALFLSDWFEVWEEV